MLIEMLSCSSFETAQYPSPTTTLKLTDDISKTSSPTDIFTPYPTKTLVPLATLQPTQAKDMLRRLLSEQELCNSPCFWKITPNQTTLGEAENVFNYLNIPLVHTFQNDRKDFYATDFGFESGVSVSIVIRVQNNLVDSLRTDIGLVNYKGSVAEQEWLAFSPKTILAQYGTPSRVEFYLSRGPQANSSIPDISYNMTVYFDSLDLIIEYISGKTKDNDLIRSCPLIDRIDNISVWLGENADHAPSKNGVPLETATSLTLEQFYSLMLQEPDTACFDLSRDAVLLNP